jgi:CDGSH-type Zn-finger protein
MADPIAPQAFPYFAAVEEGKKYQWCACGRSAAQPFCDGSHAGTGITPVEYTATATKKMSFCGCKASTSGALCDGSHNSL